MQGRTTTAGGRWAGVALSMVTALVVSAPSAAAEHWCDAVGVGISPSTVFSPDRVPIGVTVHHGAFDELNASVRLRFDWETQAVFWGTVLLPPQQSHTNAYTKVVSAEPGDHFAQITLQGNAGNEASTTCGPIMRSFHIEPLPEAPRLTIVAPETGGDAPFEGRFESFVAGGLAPVEVEWTWGDATTSAGANATHVFRRPGTYVVQAFAQDARNRTSADRMTVVVSGGGGSVAGAMQLVATTLEVVLLVVLLVVGLLILRRLPRGPPPSRP